MFEIIINITTFIKITTEPGPGGTYRGLALGGVNITNYDCARPPALSVY